MKLSLPAARYDTAAQRASFYAAVDRRLSALPGISHAALMRTIPTTPTLYTNVSVVGHLAVPARDQLKARLQAVTPGYFAAMGIPVVRGRPFEVADDDRDAPPTIIINESLARHFWPAYPDGPNPVGQRMSEGADRIASAEIVAIVGDMRQKGPADSPDHEFFVPMSFHAPQFSYLAARIAGGPQAAASMVRNAVLAVDPDQPVFNVRMMEEVLEAHFGRHRLAMRFFGAFALIAVLLSAVGIYGSMTQSVVERAREFGLRRALGARPADIAKLVFGRALRITVAGIAGGVVAALALARIIESFLFEARPSDPETLIAAALLAFVATIGAAAIPVLRAVRITPLAGLRNQ